MLNERGLQACLQAFRKGVQILGGSLQESEIVDIFLEQVANVLSTKRALVLLLSRGGDELLLAGSIGLDGPNLDREPVRVAESGISRRALGGEMVVVEDITQEPELLEFAQLNPDVRGALVIPLAVRGHVIGVLHVYMDKLGIEASEYYLLLGILADLGAVALEKVRLHQSLYRIAQALNSSLDLKSILQRVLEATVEEMWLKGASIRLLDSKKETLSLIAAYGLSDAYWAKGQVHLAKSGIDQQVLKGEVSVIYDTATAPGLEYPEDAAKEGILSIMVAPLRLENSPIGVMRVYSAQPRNFGTVATTFLRSVADLVSLAIQNAELHAALKEQYKNLKLDLADWHRFLALG